MATKIKTPIMLAVLALLACACTEKRDSLILPEGDLAITSFSINGVEAVTDSIVGQLYVTLPAGTDLSALAPQVSVSEGASVSPASGETIDFRGRTVNYRVTYGNAYRDYAVRILKAKGSKIGFIGWEDAVSNASAETAWNWLSSQYGDEAEYVSLWDLQTGTKDIYEYGTLWYYTDADGNSGWALPFRAAEAPLTAVVKDYLQEGGNLLLTGFSVRWVENLGLSDDGRPANNLYGHENKTLTADEGIAPSQPGHALFEGLETDENGVIPLVQSGATIDNNTAVWYLKDWGGYENSFDEWREATGGTELATDVVDGDANRVTACEFAPTASHRGRAICIGIGTYQWLDDGSNSYAGNIKQLTINALEYLLK